MTTDTGFKPSFVQTLTTDLASRTHTAAVSLSDELNASTATASPIYERIIEVIRNHGAQLRFDVQTEQSHAE